MPLLSKGNKIVCFCERRGASVCAEVMEYLSLYFAVEKKKETITESAGRQQKKKIGKVRKGVRCPRSTEKVTFAPSEAVLELVLSVAAGM